VIRIQRIFWLALKHEEDSLNGGEFRPVVRSVDGLLEQPPQVSGIRSLKKRKFGIIRPPPQGRKIDCSKEGSGNIPE
jgi:hypothetical protein